MQSQIEIKRAVRLQNCLQEAQQILALDLVAGFSPIVRAALFTQLLILANEVLQGLAGIDRVGFDAGSGDGKDVTTAINDARNGACHSDSPKREVDGAWFAFNVLVGRGCFTLNGQRLHNEYQDDVAIFYGANRVYLRRHIQKALADAAPRIANLARSAGAPGFGGYSQAQMSPDSTL